MKIKKRAITLLEIMIVIMIIGVISSVIGVNMKSSLDAGRSFASERGSKEIYDILAEKNSDGVAVEDLSKNMLKYLGESDIVANPKKLAKDGWKKNYQIVQTEEGKFCVYSESWRNYLEKKKNFTLEMMVEEYPWAFHASMEEKIPEQTDEAQDEDESAKE